MHRATTFLFLVFMFVSLSHTHLFVSESIAKDTPDCESQNANCPCNPTICNVYGPDQANQENQDSEYYEKLIDLHHDYIDQAIQDKDTLKAVIWASGIIGGLVLTTFAFFGLREWIPMVKTRHEVEALQKELKLDISKSEHNHNKMMDDLKALQTRLTEGIEKSEEIHNKMKQDIDRLEYYKYQQKGSRAAQLRLYKSALKEFDGILEHEDIIKITDDSDINSDIKAGAYSWKAYVYAVLNQNADALTMVEKGLEYNSNNKELLYNGAIIQLRMGNQEKALEFLRNVINLDSDYKNVIINNELQLLDKDWLPLIDNLDFKNILGLSVDTDIELPEDPIEELRRKITEVEQKLEDLTS